MVAIASLPTPPELVSSLNVYVAGQALAKQRLAMAVYRHYLGLRLRELPDADAFDLGPQHQLLLGPTGVGKSHLVKWIAKLLGVPTAFTAATSLVETGYVGTPVESMFATLFERARGDLALAEHGIVFLDEFDKLRRAPDVSRDVSGEGVQNGLLTLLDGRLVRLRHRDNDVLLDTSRVLFLCTGAFAGLPAIVRRRLGRAGGSLGFTGEAASRKELSDDELMERATPEDLIGYGLIPELVGRFAGIVPLCALSRAELLHILAEVKGSPLRAKVKLFEVHGVRLEVPADARDVLVDRAVAQGLGARGLRRVVTEAFTDIEYELSGLAKRGVGAVRMTRAAIEGHSAPEFVSRRRMKGWTQPFPSADHLRAGALGARGSTSRPAAPAPGERGAPIRKDGSSKNPLHVQVERLPETPDLFEPES